MNPHSLPQQFLFETALRILYHYVSTYALLFILNCNSELRVDFMNNFIATMICFDFKYFISTIFPLKKLYSNKQFIITHFNF